MHVHANHHHLILPLPSTSPSRLLQRKTGPTPILLPLHHPIRIRNLGTPPSKRERKPRNQRFQRRRNLTPRRHLRLYPFHLRHLGPLGDLIQNHKNVQYTSRTEFAKSFVVYFRFWRSTPTFITSSSERRTTILLVRLFIEPLVPPVLKLSLFFLFLFLFLKTHCRSNHSRRHRHMPPLYIPNHQTHLPNNASASYGLISLSSISRHKTSGYHYHHWRQLGIESGSWRLM